MAVDPFDDLSKLWPVGSNVEGPAGLVNAPRLAASDGAIRPNSKVSGSGVKEENVVHESDGSGSSSGGEVSVSGVGAAHGVGSSHWQVSGLRMKLGSGCGGMKASRLGS